MLNQNKVAKDIKALQDSQDLIGAKGAAIIIYIFTNLHQIDERSLMGLSTNEKALATQVLKTKWYNIEPEVVEVITYDPNQLIS